jgi:preprotein translocase subunit SecG
MSFSQLRPLSLGEVLDGAFTIYRRQFVSLFLTALVPQIPMILLVGLYYAFLGSLTATSTPDLSPATWITVGIAMVVLLPLAAIGSATAIGGVTFQVARAYTGTPVTTGEAIRRGFQRSLAMVGAYFVVFTLSAFGLLAFIVGFFVVWVSAFAVAPAVVLERRGPIEAISRSWALIKGAWGEVFLVVFIAGMIATLPGSAVGMFAVIGGLVLSGGDPDAIMAAQAVGQVLSQITRTLTIPFSIGTTVLLYYDRRVRSEALDVQMMAESLAPAPAPAPAAPGWG